MGRGWVLIIGLLFLTACSSGPSLYQLLEDNPDADVSVQKLAGSEAAIFAKGVKGFCPELPDEYHRAIIERENYTVTEIYDYTGDLLCSIDTSDPEYAEKSIAILVNDEPIYLEEVRQAVNTIPEEMQSDEVENLLQNMVNSELLLQEAADRGIVVNDEEVNTWIEENSVSLNQSNPEKLRNAVRERLKIQKLVSRVTESSEVEVSEEEKRSYYESNKELLVAPPSHTIRHIQINYGDRGENVTRKKANTVYKLLNTTDFCDLVEQFSQDTSSVDSCGRYNFQQGQMIPAIEEEVNNMSIGETRIVKSEQGYHILQLLSREQPQQATFEQVEGVIGDLVLQQKQQEIITNFLNQLRQEAEIISYLN